ncbi:hypothetical protein [Flavobacterium mesophilum]|uniref:hypothetical protein n=1 Tax=Flavobacterium mesophilum TaxID=3143495 RepID=UPI0031CE484F
MNPIDVACYRPLKSGKEYEKLIPPYKGIDFSFDKQEDNSNTYDTLRFMAQWSEKYAGQMSKAAPLLKGRTLKETAGNVYKFLYSHFQYKIDEGMQNLYSPSAAWHYRAKGFDCKTYSILASTILQNLQIPHSFRMIQQAGMKAGQWSHVYVVIPNGSAHYIVDATTHDNKEVAFTQKHDYNMKHRGLASPYVKFNGLGCACQGKPIAHTGLGAPAVFSKTIANFHRFLNDAEEIGIPRNVTNKMLDLVKYNVQNGIDPNMGEILRKALNELPASPALNAPITPYSTAASLSFYGDSRYAPSGLGAALINTGVTTTNTGSSSSGGLKVGGVNIGSAVSDVASGNYVGAAIGVLKNVLPIEKTFGAVFANGFDLSCWGASYSEQKAKVHVEADMPFILEWSGIYKEPSTANLDRFMYLTQAYINDSKNGQQSKYASCTRKGHALRERTVEELRKNVFEEFKSQNFQLVPAGKKKGAKLPVTLPGYGAGAVFGWANPDVEWDSYNVISPKAEPTSGTSSTTTDANGTQTTTTKNADGSTTITKTTADGKTTTETTAAKSGAGTALTIGAVALVAAKFLL